MAVPNFDPCWHCLRRGHWADNCPWLKKPENKDHHEARIATITRRFTECDIGPAAKVRMITEENRLWKLRQKELARQ